MKKKRSKIRYYKEYTVELVKSEPDRVFIFGDNLVKRGKRGQAVIRSLDNVLGIPTKRYPCMKSKSCFFSDRVDEVIEVKKALLEIEDLVKRNKKIGLPHARIGTGLAELKKRSPVIFKYITLFLTRLDHRYSNMIK